jgi:DNA-binding HxlR family transcriptional regulator
MKTASSEYTFSKAELSILKEIAKGNHELTSIEKAISITPQLLSYNLKKLGQKGFIKTTQQASKKQAYFSDSKHATLLNDLLSVHNHIDWENVLSGKVIEILLQTLNDSDSENRAATIPKNTRWRHLKNLKTRGIIIKSGSINPRFSTLSEFLGEYQKFFLRRLAATVSRDAVILWQKDAEFLMRAPETAQRLPKGFFKTATSVFQEYALPLFSESAIYLYSKDKKQIRPEDAILHTLLIEPNSTRYTTYALMLLKKIEKRLDLTYLLSEAQRLGIRNQLDCMLQFLETHKRPNDSTLPTWNEFVEKATDYNVVVA